MLKQISPFIKEAGGYHNAGTTTFATWETVVSTLKNQVEVAKTLGTF
jgi:hypothetical protein